MINNTLTLLVDGKAMTGWTAVRVTRSLDRMPADFDISATERYPSDSSLMTVEDGAPCQVMLGEDLVITGYIDRVVMSFSRNDHTIRLQGRSKSADLVDCSITPDILTGMQIITKSLLDLATRLAKPYGIKVKSLTGDDIRITTVGTGILAQFNASLGQTPYQIIEECARSAGVIFYDDAEGNVLISNVGESTMASGVAQGVNVEQATAAFAQDERFSEYLPTLMDSNLFGDQGIGGTVYTPSFDAGVKRFRQRIISSHQFVMDKNFAQMTAQWEAARLAGRGRSIHVTVDNWRDKDGTLWAPNAYAPISLPALKLANLERSWVIGSVSFVRDADRGTVADLIMMPREAFQPQPIILIPTLFNPTEPMASGHGSGP